MQDKYIALYKELITHLHIAIRKTNPGYNLVIDRLHLYYDMELVTFSIDKERNLIIQFPVFIQPYTQQPLILYQIETTSSNHRSKHTDTILYTPTYKQAIHCFKL